MRQKFMCILLLFALILVFTGCAGNNATSSKPPLENPDSKTEGNVETENATSNNNNIDAGQQDQNNQENERDEQQVKPDSSVSEDFMMQIEDVFSITGRGTVVTGKVLSGQVSVEAEVELVGLSDESKNVTIGGIEIFRKMIDTAKAGDNVGMLLNDIERSDVQRGQVLAAKGFISAHNTFSADIAFVEEQGEAFFSTGNFRALSYFLTTDSTTAFYFGDARPDENGVLSVKAQMLAKLPMKEGTAFAVRNSGVVIAAGTVTGVDVEITPELDKAFSDIHNSADQPDAETSNPANSDSDITGADISITESGSFDATLISYGNQKVNVIKTIREITGLGLKEAKELVDYAPSIIKKDLTHEEATAIKSKLEDLGATVEITKSGQ